MSRYRRACTSGAWACDLAMGRLEPPCQPASPARCIDTLRRSTFVFGISCSSPLYFVNGDSACPERNRQLELAASSSRRSGAGDSRVEVPLRQQIIAEPNLIPRRPWLTGNVIALAHLAAEAFNRAELRLAALPSHCRILRPGRARLRSGYFKHGVVFALARVFQIGRASCRERV